MDRAYTLPLILAVAATLLLLPGCKQPELDSRWHKGEIHIDGELSDWRNYPPYHLDESPAVVGFSNDADYLYLRLSTRDPHLQRQIMAGSLTIWFDSSGGKRKTLGIGFPTAQPRSRTKAAVTRSNAEPKSRPQPRRRQMELLGADGKILARLDSGNPTQGIEVAMRRQKGDLLYELKLPLAVSAVQPFAIGAPTDAQIGIGLLTKQLLRPDKNATQVQAASRGGKGDGAGRGGAGRRGGGGGRRVQPPQPLSLWVKLQLAQPPEAQRIHPQG